MLTLLASSQTNPARRHARLFARTLCGSVSTLGMTGALLLGSQPAAAQTPNLVSACSGVSLPPSVVTDIIAPVVGGIVTPVEGALNPLLGILTPLDIDVTGLLADAAAGQPITLQVLNANGTIVGPSDRCDLQADSFQLNTEGGIAIGGNRITGLGTNGLEAVAGEQGSIAFGNSATTAAAAVNAVAIGTGASVTAANSIALGAGSSAARGAQANYTALGITGTTGSAGEFSVGAAGATRQITNVAAGTAPTDAVNVAQLTGVAAQIGAVSANAVLYDTAMRDSITLTGPAGTTISNLAPGTVAAGSTEAVNGAQLFATNGNVTTNTNAITNLTTNVQNGAVGTVQYSNPATPTVPNGGIATNDLTLVGATAAPVGLHNVRAGVVAAGSTDAVNGAQLSATNDAVSINTTNIATLNTSVTSLQSDALLYDGTLQAFNASRGGTPQRITNVAAGLLGAGSLDAVNGGQLFGLGNSLALALGGTSAYDPATGTVTAGIVYGGTNYGSVQGAVSAIETSIGTTIDANTRYFNANSVRPDSQALGTDSTAIGPNAIASADGSIAAGRNTVAGSAGSVAIGDGSSTIAGRAVAIGFANIASGDGAVAIGDPNIALGDGAVALGRDNEATGTGAVALGDTNFATGNGSVSIGQLNQATGDGTIAIGANNLVNGTGALAFGNRNLVNGNGSLAFGSDIVTGGVNTLAVGNASAATGDNAAVFGNGSAASGLNSTALGTSSLASADYTLAVGERSLASGFGASALGTLSSATAFASTALGAGAIANLENSVALGSASSTLRGGVASYTAFGLAGTQSSIGEIAVARTADYIDPATGTFAPLGTRQITGVGAGSEDTDAVNVAQLRGVSSTLGTSFVTSLGGGAAYNVTTGAITGPTYVINGTSYTNVGDALAGVSGQIGQVATNSVSYDNAAQTSVTLGGAGGTTITNLAAGAVNATSTDAVNGAQLNATNQAVASNTTAITNLGNTVNDLSTTVTNLGDTVANLDASVTNVSTAVTNLGDDINNGAIGTVQYSNPDDPTTPNGGVPTNDLTLVGATAAPVGLHNVAAGSIAAGSTDAVNGGQVFALAQASANAVTYNTDVNGVRTNTITLAGGNAAAPVTINNVAAGALNAGSTDAVNGAQLFATNQNVATVTNTANSALTLAQNAVQYDASRTSVTFNNGGAATTLQNVAAGVSATDAVNVSQLNAGINSAVTQANNYTDSRFAGLDFDLREVRRDSRAGTAGALAAAGLPQAYEAGKGMIAIAGGTYGGQSAFALGFSKAFNDGSTVVKLSGSYDSQGRAGAAGGIGYQF